MDLEKFLVSLHVRTRDVGFFCALAQSPQSARLCPPPPPSQLHDSDVTRRIVAVQCSSVVTMLHHQASSWNGPDLASTSRLTLVQKMIPSPRGNQIFVDSYAAPPPCSAAPPDTCAHHSSTRPACSVYIKNCVNTSCVDALYTRPEQILRVLTGLPSL